MSGRVIAMGDVHGCDRALEALLEFISLDHNDVLVQLGDLIDRGPNSQRVIDLILSIDKATRTVLIRGNHEELFLDALESKTNIQRWLRNGGVETLHSYGWSKGGPSRHLSSWFPASHLQLLTNMKDYFETENAIFVHAGYDPSIDMEHQSSLALRWRVANESNAVPHTSGKIVVVGHTPQRSGQILDLGFLYCIDTDCVRGGWLTAFDVASGQVWQANQKGETRFA